MSSLQTFLDPLGVDAFQAEYLGWRPLYRHATPERHAWVADWATATLDAVRDDFAHALRVPAASVHTTLVSDAAGAVRSIPADPVDTIAVVLCGVQQWRIAPGAEDPADRGMPVETYRLEPGAAIYVPRGWWHETTSEGACLTLLIEHTPPAALDIVLAAVRAHLERDCRWPSRALALWDADRRSRSHEDLVLA